MRQSRRRALEIVFGLAVLLAFLLACSCNWLSGGRKNDEKGKREGTGTTVAATKTEAKLDTARAVAAKVTVADGGVISVKNPGGTTSTIEFFPDSLYNTATIEVTPLLEAPVHDAGTLVDGISVRKVGARSSSEHLELYSPALVTFVIKSGSKGNPMVVEYVDGPEKYVPRATIRTESPEGTRLIAYVPRFSEVGVRDVGTDEAKKSKSLSSTGYRITINDVVKATNSLWKFTYHLWFDATLADTSSGLAGVYRGSASLRSVGKADSSIQQLVKIKVDFGGFSRGTAQVDLASNGAAGPQGPAFVGKATLDLTGTGNLNAMARGVQREKVDYSDGRTHSETVQATVVSPDGTHVELTIPNIGTFRGRMLPAPTDDEDECEKANVKSGNEHRNRILEKYRSVQKAREGSYSSAHAAAMAGIESIRAACADGAYEWGGGVCLDSAGRYHVQPGGAHHCGTDFEQTGVQASRTSCPKGMQISAAYHCHPPNRGKLNSGDMEGMEEGNLEETVVLTQDKGKTEVQVQTRSGDKMPPALKNRPSPQGPPPTFPLPKPR